ncbi:hypothetical protein HWI79_3497 [Cryptosporidium felis]|nr:hypothetical protein HWI79_3497 [Cryptosporidium felis]
MRTGLVELQLKPNCEILSGFFLDESLTDGQGLFRLFTLEYSKNILVLSFKNQVSEVDRCEWLIKYCEKVSEQSVSREELEANKTTEQAYYFENVHKSILLILDRDFHRSIKLDSNQLSRYKLLDNVLVKFSDRLSLTSNSKGCEISLFEIIIRIHELFRYGEFKYLIINQFEKLINSDEHLTNESKMIFYSFLFSLISNIKIDNRDGDIRILIID